MHIIKTIFDINQFEQSQVIVSPLGVHFEQKLKTLKEALELYKVVKIALNFHVKQILV